MKRQKTFLYAGHRYRIVYTTPFGEAEARKKAKLFYPDDNTAVKKLSYTDSKGRAIYAIGIRK
jgi:hypothetical protein